MPEAHSAPGAALRASPGHPARGSRLALCVPRIHELHHFLVMFSPSVSAAALTDYGLG